MAGVEKFLNRKFPSEKKKGQPPFRIFFDCFYKLYIFHNVMKQKGIISEKPLG